MLPCAKMAGTNPQARFSCARTSCLEAESFRLGLRVLVAWQRGRVGGECNFDVQFTMCHGDIG